MKIDKSMSVGGYRLSRGMLLGGLYYYFWLGPSTFGQRCLYTASVVLVLVARECLNFLGLIQNV